MKVHDEDELYATGQLYKAVSETVLVEVEPSPLLAGMKLLLHPEQIIVLKLLQKGLRNRLGYKPKIELVLNALVAKTDVEDALNGIPEWLEEHSEGESRRVQASSLYPAEKRSEYREEDEGEKCGESGAATQ